MHAPRLLRCIGIAQLLIAAYLYERDFLIALVFVVIGLGLIHASYQTPKKRRR